MSDDIAVFLLVCDQRSFVAAATRMNLSPSAVAKSVARLEARLGVSLFQRTTRRLIITPEGELYRDACRPALADIARVEGSLTSLRSEPAGTVRISLPPLFGTRVIAPALFELSRHWPRLEFAIETSTAYQDLSGGSIDLAVRIGEMPDTGGLMARGLGMQRLALCASAAYLGDNSLPTALSDLDDHKLIATAQGERAIAWHFDVGGQSITYHPKSRLRLDGSLLTLEAIRANQGLGIVPRWLVRDALASGELIEALPGLLAGHLPVRLLWAANAVMLPRLRVSMDAVIAAATTFLSSDMRSTAPEKP